MLEKNDFQMEAAYYARVPGDTSKTTHSLSWSSWVEGPGTANLVPALSMT